MAEALLKVLANNIYTMIHQEIGMLWGIEEEMQKLASLFTTIRAIMEDAEEKQFRDIAVRNWLQKLTVATHEIDDILDDIKLEASKVQYGGSCRMPSFCSPSNLLFRRKIGKRMKDITKKLDSIAEERIKFHFNEFPVRQERNDFIDLRESSSMLTQLEVFGRDGEKEKIVEILVNQIRDTQNTFVLPIVGVGGLGKTTLAQLVFNDQLITENFGLKLWVCVSDDFNVKKLTKAIIETALGTPLETMDLDPLQRKLQEILIGKRFLLVLDDVWNDDQEKWDKFNCVLSCGSKGSAIITTTRMQKVASIMGTLPSHNLSSLSEDYCWLLFRQRALGLEGEEQYPNLVAIGKDIVKKCSGVPLAVKALGGLLRFKRRESEWIFVKESELWNLPQDEMSILPALRLSYQNLPQELRPCFTYCAIYPKDTVIEKSDIIRCWIANGIISSNGSLEVEDVGDAIWTELYWRSLFQDLKKDTLGKIRFFKMHDLVHDLAESVMDGKYPSSREFLSTGYRPDSTIRHIEIRGRNELFLAFPKSIKGCSSSIAEFGSARMFINKTSPCRKKLWSSAIANMKHLRHLDLSYGTFSALPSSICYLWNLQALILDNCSYLRSLPKNLRYLRDLRYLRFTESPVNCMPKKIGQLTCLKVLSKFVVGNKERGYGISELRNLNLQGMLSIENLKQVGNKEDAQQVNLHEKQHLRGLCLSWGSRKRSKKENDQQVLEALKPHINLQGLKIIGFNGTCFPSWMNEVSTLKNITWISFYNCENCTHLPKLRFLPNLQRLDLVLVPVEYIDESQDADDLAEFPSLRHIEIFKMLFLKGFSRSRGHIGVIFPHLQVLKISHCPMLSLCNNVEFSSTSQVGVEQNVNVLGEINTRENQSSEKMELKYLSSLVELDLHQLNWAALPEVLQHGHLLQYLHLASFPNLTSLPQWLEELTVLESLEIDECPKLQSLPDNMQRMKKLQHLEICRCPELVRGCDEENGEEWHKIKHITHRFMISDEIAGYMIRKLITPFQHFDYMFSD